MININVRGVIFALSAALFYALNIPVSKIMLKDIPPVLMAAFMYLGAGIGVGIMYLPHLKHETPSERLCREDLPYVLGMILLDIIAPILLMIGVNTGTASNASLLGNLETVFTALIALLLFHEKISVRLWLAVALITFSGMLLTFDVKEGLSFSSGSIFVLGAAACWGLENNCTNAISRRSAYEIVTIKGLCSGAGSLIIGLSAGNSLPDAKHTASALVLGFMAYGLSIFTYIRAQNILGAAKTGAYYASTPFIGGLLSFVLLGEKLSTGYALAFIIMSAGTVLAVIDTLHKHHLHEHSHRVFSIHGGRIHSYVITHCHEHNHYLTGRNHIHSHKRADHK